jgi:1-acyl-sn-glycerol-3-phosphate acyltransferase
MMRRIGSWYMRLTGWKILGSPPEAKKFVAIGWPHTSNWDYLLFLGVTRLFKVPAKAIGKHTLVTGPFGWMFRKAVIPIERDSGQGLVDQMVEVFDSSDELAVVIAPEGTRRYEDHWRSGFYHIAHAAGVPVVPAYIIWPRKLVEVGPPITLTGDVTRDMDAIRSFMAPGRGKHPDQAAPIRLREELPPM